MALQLRVAFLVPETGEPGMTLRPHMGAVFTGIAMLIAALFIAKGTIEFISDDRMFFMSFASFVMSFTFLILAGNGDHAALVSWNTGTPNHVGTPDHVESAG